MELVNSVVPQKQYDLGLLYLFGPTIRICMVFNTALFFNALLVKCWQKFLITVWLRLHCSQIMRHIVHVTSEILRLLMSG